MRVSFVLSLFSFTPNAVYVHSPVIPCTYLLLVSDVAFTVLFVQLCLVPCDVLTELIHVLLRCLFGPELPDGPGLCCSLAHECTRKPLLSLGPPSTSAQCKLSWIHLLIHLQPLFLSVYLRPLFQQSAFAFRWSQPPSSWRPTNALVHLRQ